jgi:DNA-binding transcriptional regulator GbsR (MarR family)
MFSTTLTNSRSFGATYQWAILSVLPMNSDKNRRGLNSPEIKEALGLSNAARTSLCLMMKEMSAEGLVQRYDYKVGKRRFVTYKRILPLRKRERIARLIRGV